MDTFAPDRLAEGNPDRVTVGDRLRVRHWYVPHPGIPDAQGLIRDEGGDVVTIDDNVTVPPGTEGRVVSVADHQIGVAWDNGSRLFLLPDRDQYALVQSAADPRLPGPG